MDFDAAALDHRGRIWPPREDHDQPLTFRSTTSPNESPVLLSSQGYKLARKKGDLQQAIVLCKEAVRRAPAEPLHHLHLGRVYLLAGKKHLALYAFRRGLKHGHHHSLVSEIRRLGFRRPPVFPCLGRKHPLNKFAGLFFARLGWR